MNFTLTACPPPMLFLLFLSVCLSVCLVYFSDPALSGCSAAVEQALMAWDFLSCSRDLVGLVLPPAKRMIDALTPPTGKVRCVPGRRWRLNLFVVFYSHSNFLTTKV